MTIKAEELERMGGRSLVHADIARKVLEENRENRLAAHWRALRWTWAGPSGS